MWDMMVQICPRKGMSCFFPLLLTFQHHVCGCYPLHSQNISIQCIVILSYTWRMRRHIVECLTTLYFLIIFSFSSSHVLTAVKALSCLFYKTSQVLALQKNLKVQSAWLDGVVINAGQGRVWVGRPANACMQEHAIHPSGIFGTSFSNTRPIVSKWQRQCSGHARLTFR